MSGKRRSLVWAKVAVDKIRNTATMLAARKRRHRTLLFNTGNPPQDVIQLLNLNLKNCTTARRELLLRARGSRSFRKTGELIDDFIGHLLFDFHVCCVIVSRALST